MLLCLGLDFKRGGFVDRALEAFKEVLRLDPRNRYALLNLQKLHEEQHQWVEARRRARADRGHRRRRAGVRNQPDPRVPPQRARRARRCVLTDAAAAGTSRRPSTSTADGAGLSEPRRRRASERGEAAAAVEAWEQLMRTVPERAYLALDRLERAYQLGRHAPAIRRAVPAAHRPESAGLAGAAGAVAPSAAAGRHRRRSICCSTRCRTTRTA